MTTLLTWRMRMRTLGSFRLRMALLFAALAATTLTLLTSLPAHAEPTPAPTTSAPAAPEQRAPSAEEMEEMEQLLKEQGERLSKGAQEAMLEAEKERLRKMLPDEGGVLGVFNVTDKNGLPISVYTVKSDTGDLLDWDLGIQNLLTELCFMITKWAIAFCCWLIAWALSFGLAKLLLAPVLAVANSLHTRVILEMGLPSLFLSVCALVCVARIFFGDRARGWGDAALSLLLAALTATLLSSPPQVLLGEETGAIALTRGLALEVADVILDANPSDPQDNDVTTPATATSLSRPLTDALTDAFITKPAMLLQYGRVFEGECATAYADTRLEQLAYDRAVQSRVNKLKKVNGYADYLSPSSWVGLPGASSVLNNGLELGTRWGVDHFGDPPMGRFEEKCVPGDVDAAKKASLDKLGGSVFLLVAAFIVTILISALAGSFLLAQCRIAWDAVRGEPALIAGTIPGAGRAFLWDWAASVLHRLGQMLASVIGLAVLILIIQAVLDPAQEDWGRELTLRFLVVDIVCLGAIKKRKALAARSKQVASNWRAKMSNARVGGTHGSVFTPPATSTVPKNRHIVRTTTRGLVRGAIAGVALAHGNPLAAIGYAMPRTIGATALMSRLQSGGRRGQGPRPRPAGRTHPRPSVPRPQPGQSPQPGIPAHPGPPPQAGVPAQPGLPPARSRPAGTNRPAGAPRRGGPATPTARQRTPAAAPVNHPSTGGTPASPAGSPRRHVQAHRAVARRTQQATNAASRRSGPGSFEDQLAQREEQELARRRRRLRGTS
ncbi:proline-rich domain-containing protein [Streptomyces sp. NPDC048565]|uniref:proline-rich domain-containing protein n=1 Tax=Streptomyces sp. NPDC048565 TaxID=3155266 RepID=UPI0034351E83